MSSIFRKVHTSFWPDEYIHEKLTDPDEILLYLALITSPKSTVCGIYTATPVHFASITKIPLAKVQQIMERFERDGKILYCPETEEVMVLNTSRYNGGLKNSKYLMYIQQELMNIKHQPFLTRWFNQLQKFRIDITPQYKQDKGGAQYVHGFTLQDILGGRKDEQSAPAEAPPLIKKPRKKREVKEKKETPGVHLVIDRFAVIFEEIVRAKPEISGADAAQVKARLKKMTVEEAMNLIEYAVDVYFRAKPDGRGAPGSLGSCFASFIQNSYRAEWANRKWNYGDQEKPITNTRWWR